MTSSNGNILLVTGPLWGESTDRRWIPLTNANSRDAGNLGGHGDHRDVTLMDEVRMPLVGILFIRDHTQAHGVHLFPKFTHVPCSVASKHHPLRWPFVRGIHRSPVNSPHKGQWPIFVILSTSCIVSDTMRTGAYPSSAFRVTNYLGRVVIVSCEHLRQLKLCFSSAFTQYISG